MEACLQVEELAGREERVNVELLRHHANGGASLARVRVDVDAPDLDAAAALQHQSREDIDQRRLAGTVGPQQAEDGAARYRQIDRVERELVRLPLAAAIDFGEAAHLDREMPGCSVQLDFMRG